MVNKMCWLLLPASFRICRPNHALEFKCAMIVNAVSLRWKGWMQKTKRTQYTIQNMEAVSLWTADEKQTTQRRLYTI